MLIGGYNCIAMYIYNYNIYIYIYIYLYDILTCFYDS